MTSRTQRNRKQRSDWQEFFPDLTPWRSGYLVRRQGPLLIGLCLDSSSYPQEYHPTCFIHNLLCMEDCVSLSYQATFSDRGCERVALRFGADIAEAAQQFREKAPFLEKEITFGDFFDRIKTLKDPTFRGKAGYPPNVALDLVTVGSVLGDKQYYVGNMERCLSIFFKLELWMEGDWEELRAWKEKMRAAVSGDLQARLDEAVAMLKLENIPDAGLEYDRRADKFWRYV